MSVLYLSSCNIIAAGASELYCCLWYNSYCSIVFWSSGRWPTKRLPYWFYEMNFSRLSYFSAIFSTFVSVLKCCRQRVNDTFRRSWVYLTVIGELAFLVWIAECVSTTTMSCNQHVASTPWRRDTLRVHLIRCLIGSNKLLVAHSQCMMANSRYMDQIWYCIVAIPLLRTVLW